MDFEEKLRKKLGEAFQPSILRIENESARHAGHAGNPGHGNSHFHIKMTASVFKGLPRVEAQRRVYAVLAVELQETIHALSLDLTGE